jgi:hypothetical protein
MTPRDLVEMASLDALGLLDEAERAEFESAFRAASPEVQAAVRRAQLRATKIDDLLPKVDPPPGLKARVVAAVRTAIAAVTLESDTQTSPVAAGGYASQAHEPSAFTKLLNSAFVWRTACLGFATATIVLGVFYNIVTRNLSEVTDRVRTESYAAEFRDYFGPAFADSMMGPQSMWLSFAPAAQDLDLGTSVDEIRAKLLYDPDRRVAFVRVEGLPDVNARYHVVVEQPNGGNRRQVEFFGSHDAIFRQINNIDAADVNSLIIYAPNASGNGYTPVLRTVAAM